MVRPPSVEFFSNADPGGEPTTSEPADPPAPFRFFADEARPRRQFQQDAARPRPILLIFPITVARAIFYEIPIRRRSAWWFRPRTTLREQRNDDDPPRHGNLPEQSRTCDARGQEPQMLGWTAPRH